MKKIALVFVIVLAFAAGYLVHKHFKGREAGTDQSEKESKSQIWTCSMHPQIKRPKPGQCPICEMDLIPLAAGGAGEEGGRTLVVTEAAKALAEIQTSSVERKFVTASWQEKLITTRRVFST
jgi:Cu(I)/Ag(I) efflux system membrane fusion protein